MDPFSLVADELSLIADRLRSMVIAEVRELGYSLTKTIFCLLVSGDADDA